MSTYAVSQLPSGCNNSTTSLTVASGDGARFAIPAGSVTRWALLHDVTLGVADEWVAITVRSTDTLTVVRAQRRTTAQEFPAGAVIISGITGDFWLQSTEVIGEDATVAGKATSNAPAVFTQLAVNAANSGTYIIRGECDGSTTDTPIFGKVSQASNGLFTGLRVFSSRAVDMGDGFGAAIVLSIMDDAAVLNAIGQIGAVRAGADNTGRLVLRTPISGTFGDRVTIDGTTTIVKQDLQVDGNTTLGNASTDTITMTGRCIFRTAASDPKHATAGSRPAGSVGEVAYYSGKLYFCTNAATPTWEQITSS